MKFNSIPATSAQTNRLNMIQSISIVTKMIAMVLADEQPPRTCELLAPPARRILSEAGAFAWALVQVYPDDHPRFVSSDEMESLKSAFATTLTQIVGNDIQFEVTTSRPLPGEQIRGRTASHCCRYQLLLASAVDV